MVHKENQSGPPITLNSDDMEELKKIIIEFLSKYEALYEKRIQKLVFYTDVHTAQETGERLTNAAFMPYDYGPYSKAVAKAVEQLEEEGRIRSIPNGQYATDLQGGELSPKKRYLIDKIHQETQRMSTDELVERSKETWLWENFEYAEEMDFATYVDEVIMSPEVRRGMEEPDRDPVDDPDLEKLLL